MQQYNFTVVHRPGEKHGNADTLSRRPCVLDDCRYCPIQEAKEDQRIQMNSDAPRVSQVTLNWQASPLWSDKDLCEAQIADSDIGPIARWLSKDGNKPAWQTVAPHSEATKMYWAQWSSLCLRNGVIYRLWETPAGDSTDLKFCFRKY